MRRGCGGQAGSGVGRVGANATGSGAQARRVRRCGRRGLLGCKPRERLGGFLKRRCGREPAQPARSASAITPLPTRSSTPLPRRSRQASRSCRYSTGRSLAMLGTPSQATSGARPRTSAGGRARSTTGNRHRDWSSTPATQTTILANGQSFGMRAQCGRLKERRSAASTIGTSRSSWNPRKGTGPSASLTADTAPTVWTVPSCGPGSNARRR